MLNGVKLDGMDELIKAFGKLPEEAIRSIDAPATKCANLVMDRARARIHNITGDLSKSLKVAKPSKTSNFKIFAKVTFTTKGAHGVPVELGHKLVIKGNTVGTVKEKPFLRPAADESKDEVVSAMAAAMNEALAKWGEK